LFLQSLAEDQIASTSNGENNSQKNVEDKDLVESLENIINFWTDYMKVQYHPQSLYEMNGLYYVLQRRFEHNQLRNCHQTFTEQFKTYHYSTTHVTLGTKNKFS
jgi:hypothetical protein